MPRYVALLDHEGLSRLRSDMKNGSLSTNRPSDYRSADEPVPDGFVAIHYFTADSGTDAHAYFLKLKADGVPADIKVVGNASKSSGSGLWRWRGDRHHIKANLPRFGLGEHHEKLLQANPQFKGLTGMLGQLCEQYHKARKHDGIAQIPAWQKQTIRESLKAAELEVAKLGVLLASAIEAIDSCYRAFDEPHDRGYRIAFGPEVAHEPAPQPETPPTPAAPTEPSESVPKKPNPKQANPAGVK